MRLSCKEVYLSIYQSINQSINHTVAGEVSERTESRRSVFLGSGPLHDGGKRQITA